MSDDALLTYLDAAREAALHAAVVLDKWRNKFRVREKGRFDLVTEADVESQRTIQRYLLERFPDHGFLGEEEPAAKNRPGPDAPPTWIVDPIDGTTNYVHDCPHYCISIGLQIAGEMVVGVIHEPSRAETFQAAKGHGAWLGERRLQVSGVDRLEDALLGTGFPPDVRGHERVLKLWETFAERAQSLRRTGSTALNVAYVAAGRFDGFWALDNHVWDVAAGVVLVQEAGGSVTNFDGETYDHFRPDTIATNGRIHTVLLETLRATD